MTSHMRSHMGTPTWDSHMGSPTDGRTDGRTYEESYSPTMDTSSSVTRTRTYGFSPLVDSSKDATTTCPACSRPMSVLIPGTTRPRRYCSRYCVLRANPPYSESREVDDVVVDRLLAGDVIHSTKGERLAAVAILTARGRSTSWIAAQLHLAERSVSRLRAELHTRREVAE